MQSTEPEGTYDENRGNPLHGVRCRNEIRPGFVLKVSPTPVAHIEEGIGLFADRCHIRRSDPLCGNVRRPDAEPLVWLSAAARGSVGLPPQQGLPRRLPASVFELWHRLQLVLGRVIDDMVGIPVFVSCTHGPVGTVDLPRRCAGIVDAYRRLVDWRGRGR